MRYLGYLLCRGWGWDGVGWGHSCFRGCAGFRFLGRAVQVAVRVSGVLQGEGEVRSVAGTR